MRLVSKGVASILFFVSAYINVVNAQEKVFDIKGKFNTETNTKLETIKLQLTKLEDDKLIKVEFANLDGTFLFEKITSGQYILTGESSVFEPYISAIITLDQDINLGLIKIDLININLKEVTIKSTKPFIKQEYDKTVINVSSSLTTAGKSALEILQQAPGISIDQNDNIAIRGRQGVLIMIDGKITPMNGQDLANMLRNMQADQIDKIDLITNPSAKYDAAGNSGIIDIKLKKGKNNGTNATVTLNIGQGVYSKLNPSINFNHRTETMNIFGSYNYSSKNEFSTLDILRDFYDSNNQLTSSKNYKNDFKFRFNNQNARLGSDFYIGKNSILGFVANGNFSDTRVKSNSVAQSLNAQGENSGYFITNGSNDPNRENNSLNINYKQTLASGRELTADFDYASFNSNEIQNYLTSYFDNNSNPSQNPYKLKGDLMGDLKITSFKIDYQQPLKK